MNIGSRFRQDVGYYFLGVIIPGLINAATVPLLKHILGTSEFGRYSIRFNSLLLLTAFSVGWICQAIIRFKFSLNGGEVLFYRKIFKFGSGIVSVLALISILVNFLYYQYGGLYSLLYGLAIIFCGYQNIFIGVSQANFHSRFIVYSEAIRTAVFFLLAMTLLRFRIFNSINILFFSLLCSYIVSGTLLFKKNRLGFVLFKDSARLETAKFSLNPMLKYGLPLAAWYLISYLILFLDKPLLAHNMGFEVQGNYQALYEIISKGAMVFMMPVVNAIFPLLSDAFEKNNRALGMRLLKKIILIEFAILIAALVAYWLFGFSLLRVLLSVPDTLDFKLCGFFMLLSTLIWQIGMLVHKPFELKMKTAIMLLAVLASMAVFMVGYFAIRAYQPVNAYIYTLPFLSASISYVGLCLLMNGYHRRFLEHFRHAPTVFKRIMNK